MSDKIDASKISKEIFKYLDEYREDIEEDVVLLANEIGKEAKAEIKSVSETKFKKHNRENPYHTGWTIKKNKYSNRKYTIQLWNKTNYQLTHLLEFGHATRNGKRTRAVPHIRPVEEKFSKEFENRLKKAIRR